MPTHKAHKELPDRGLLNLVTQKLEAGNKPEDIEAMLIRAGLDIGVVRDAVRHAREKDVWRHQREAEQNGFLPPLNKGIRKGEEVAGSLARIIGSEISHGGLFSGRLRRKDFIIGILFFFGLGFIAANVISAWLQYFAPEFAAAAEGIVLGDQYGFWLMFVPFLFAPITLMVLSLMTRRLHNIGLPGWISFLYLLAFVSPFGAFGGYAMFGIHVVLFVLFVVMLTVKGHPNPNKHGSLPPSIGSMFARVWGK